MTIGSEGSAGDFAPALAIGGLAGGAFGRAAELLLADPRIDAGAFALVGMGAFYGGIAHVPLSALVLVCELAGTYDLLVPLMLALAIAFVALRKRSLYDAQVPTLRDSPVHRGTPAARSAHRRERARRDEPPPPRQLRPRDRRPRRCCKLSADVPWQDVFPVIDGEQRMVGLVGSAALRLLATEGEASHWAAGGGSDAGPVSVLPEDDLGHAAQQLLANGLREIAVVDRERQLLGVLDEVQIAEAYLRAARQGG